MAVASACTNSIRCASKVGSSAKVISAALRLPNGSQISDGLNKKRSDADTTVTSTSSPSSYLSSKAAVRPPKLPPITSTRLPAIIATHSLVTDTHEGIRDQGRPARSRATGTKVTDAGTGRPDPPRRSRTWQSLTGLEDHRPGGHVYPPLMAGRCYWRPPAFPPCTRPPNTQQQPGTQIGRICAAAAISRLPPPKVHNGGSARVLPERARHSASHRRSASSRGRPSIQRRLDWSAGGPWVAGRGSCRCSIQRRHGHLMLELTGDMRHDRTFIPRWVLHRHAVE